MPILLRDSQRILFIHIPKTGGTAIEGWLRSLGELDFFEPASSDGFRVTPQHFTLADHLALHTSGDWDYVFTVVRNPYDRLRSEYQWRAGAEYRESQHWPNISTWIERNLRNFESAHPTIWDNHLRPQSDFVGPRVEVFHYEDGLDSICTSVAERIGAETPENNLPRVRESSAKNDAPLTPRALSFVNRVYETDFEWFEYDRVGPALPTIVRV